MGPHGCLPAFQQGGNIQAICAQDGTAHVDAKQCGKTEKFDYVGASTWPLTINLSPAELWSLSFKIAG